jgi:hypothetical protein
MDRDFLQWGAQFIGLAGAAFWGGMKGGKRAFKAMRETVEDIQARVEGIETRLGIPHTPRPKNGATADLGLADHQTSGGTSHVRDRQ